MRRSVRSFLFRPLVSLLQILSRFFQRAESVVVGLGGLAVFVDGAFALAGDIENLSQLDAAPDLGPARFAVAVDGFAIGVGRGLVVPLIEENIRDAVVRERTVLVEIKRLVEFQERARQVSLLLQSLTAQDGGALLHVAGIGE